MDVYQHKEVAYRKLYGFSAKDEYSVSFFCWYTTHSYLLNSFSLFVRTNQFSAGAKILSIEGAAINIGL